ncbi:hypothetical protein Lepto7376_1078 [[Leptolyngbya] sp. PCC 7376]|uniref:DUF4278 domain-containing protein n=1 Tax=[Leptolyngbya] sp. PCC 7376 TaxID=111781 RepID=UPI00029F0708|nr:DUF4278 domain-containing protein [[Leptolyngbya] sp. PCC 7376]AFY37448.1 hypothetical protein Lepto7376_1078 [[Leptolyngbya] sp. PCC 7376]
MTTFTFLGSNVSYEPTRIATKVDHGNTTKYRGQTYEHHQAIANTSSKKGLTYRGVTY